MKEDLVKSIIEAQKVCNYFEGYLIGSILLVNHIENDLINDIDIAVHKDMYFRLKAYFYDLGFKETKEGYKQKGYADTIGSLIFERLGYIPIHLSFIQEGFGILSIPEILKEKIIRYNKSDRKQIASFVDLNKTKGW